MRKNLKIVVLVLLFAAASCSFTTKQLQSTEKDQVLVELITFVLQKGHYDAKQIDDAFSRSVYDSYLQTIDSRKRYFYKSDIEEFAQYRELIDDQINNKEIDFFDLAHSRLLKRMEEVQSIYKDILEEPFDFSEEENINTDYDAVDFPTNKKGMRERWRKQLKFSTLATFYDQKKQQQQAMENEPDYEAKTDAELEVEAREITKSSLDEYFEFSNELERKDWFTMYVNAIVETFDPHTFYFAPQDKEKFDIAMSGKLEGIGARLQKKNENVKIVEIISGGPAWRSEELEVGDEIMKVKQEDEQEPVSVLGMRLDDAVNLIKGPKGSKVVLTVRKVDGTIEDITMERDVVEIEETYAKSSVVKKNGRNYGVINLPKFYFDMEDYKTRNAASDVEKEIERLKEENMEGLVLDLRNNGGGSLKTVVDIAGLFIEKGPIVQVRSGDNDKEVLRDTNRSVLWDGPLVILVNELSASASEILAAAMQDYKRAIIIGSEQTYGKGTVQNVIDLNRWMRNSDFGDMGALKLTTQKFYRVNGGSTQLEGVKSDVVVPDRYSYIDIGEKDQANPLPWDQIEAAKYEIWDGYINYEETIKNSIKRMENNAQLNLIAENAKWIKAQTEEMEFPLQYEKYKMEVEENEAQAKKFEDISKYESNLTYESLPYERDLFATDTTLEEKRNRWHKNLSGDVYVEEAIHVLEDWKIDSLKENKVANRKRMKN